MQNGLPNFTRIIVIGNGFDLNLGLKTSYTDFLNSPDFASLCINDNKLASYLKGRHKLKLWIDIENELKLYGNNSPVNFESDYDDLCAALLDYLRGLDYTQLNFDSHAYKLIKDTWDKGVLILDFNYTSAVKTILQKFVFDRSEIDSRVLKIHGSVEIGSIVFGIEDEARIKRDYIFLKKTCNINYKPIQFRRLLEQADEIFFFGHSLGETDHTYFKDFFSGICSDNTNRRTINLYYYGKAGFKEIHIQLDELTFHRVGLFKQHTNLNQIDASI